MLCRGLEHGRHTLRLCQYCLRLLSSVPASPTWPSVSSSLLTSLIVGTIDVSKPLQLEEEKHLDLISQFEVNLVCIFSFRRFLSSSPSRACRPVPSQPSCVHSFSSLLFSPLFGLLDYTHHTGLLYSGAYTCH